MSLELATTIVQLQDFISEDNRLVKTRVESVEDRMGDCIPLLFLKRGDLPNQERPSPQCASLKPSVISSQPPQIGRSTEDCNPSKWGDRGEMGWGGGAHLSPNSITICLHGNNLNKYSLCHQ